MRQTYSNLNCGIVHYCLVFSHSAMPIRTNQHLHFLYRDLLLAYCHHIKCKCQPVDCVLQADWQSVQK